VGAPRKPKGKYNKDSKGLRTNRLIAALKVRRQILPF
jgi:hypothetical protein